MKGTPSHTQSVTQIHDLSLWSAEPTRGSEKQLVKKSMKPRPKKHTPTSQKELARLDNSDLATSLWYYKKNTAAQFKDPTEMLNAIYITTSELEGYTTAKNVLSEGHAIL